MYFSQWVSKVNCLMGFHDTYSNAADMNFKFDSIDLKNKSTDEVMEIFSDLTTTRCRHCKWTFGSKFK